VKFWSLGRSALSSPRFNVDWIGHRLSRSLSQWKFWSMYASYDNSASERTMSGSSCTMPLLTFTESCDDEDDDDNDDDDDGDDEDTDSNGNNVDDGNECGDDEDYVGEYDKDDVFEDVTG